MSESENLQRARNALAKIKDIAGDADIQCKARCARDLGRIQEIAAQAIEASIPEESLSYVDSEGNKIEVKCHPLGLGEK